VIVEKKMADVELIIKKKVKRGYQKRTN